MTAVTLYLRIV